MFLSEKAYSRRADISSQLNIPSARSLSFPARENILEYEIEGSTRSRVPSLRAEIKITPRPSVLWTAYRIVLAALILVLTGAVVLFVFRSLAPEGAEAGAMRRLSISALLGLLLGFLATAVAQADSYGDLLRVLDFPALKVLLLQGLLAASLPLLYLVSVRAGSPPAVWPFLAGGLFLAVHPVFNFVISGDGRQWIFLIAHPQREIPFAELLGFFLAKTALGCLRAFIDGLEAYQVLAWQSKIIGVFFIFVLYSFLRGQSDMPRENRTAGLIMAALLPVSAFFFGYPEFGFYPLPFLLLSLTFSGRFLDASASVKNLALAAFFLAMAGLFHGSGFFCLPAVLLLPFLKRRQPGAGRRWPVIIGETLVVVLVLALTVGAAVWLVSSLGFSIGFENVSGGGDRHMFVDSDFAPATVSSSEIWLEIRYLGERGFAVALGFPLVLFLVLPRLRRRSGGSTKDDVLYLFAICQMGIFLFWGFDLGYRDLDLMTSPLTFFALLSLKLLLDRFNPNGAPARNAWLIFLFAATTPLLVVFHIITRR